MSHRVPTPEEIRLEAELETAHGEIHKLGRINDKLREALKAKVVITRKIKKRVGVKYFPAIMLMLIKQFSKDKDDFISGLYLKYMSLINYAVVAGIGVLINMFVLYTLVTMFPLWMANGLAILIAFLWNWTLSVGPFGYLMGLQPEVEEEESFEPTD